MHILCATSDWQAFSLIDRLLKKVMLNSYKNYVTMDGGDSVNNGDVSYRFTHDVKAGLSLRWAHMGFFIDTFMFHFNEPRFEKTIVQLFLSFLNLIFHACSRLLRFLILGPGRKPQSRQVFSRRGDGFENYTVHVCLFFFSFCNLDIFKI